MQLTGSKLYTEPKISPANPSAAHMTTEWYVWFRYYDSHSQKWKQLRYKKGINEYKIFRERLKEANALCQVLKEELKEGWNPLQSDQPKAVKIYTIESAIDHILKIKAATLRKKTKYSYEYIFKLFKEWLELKNLLGTGVKYFSGSQAQEYMDWMLLKKGYSGRTFNDHLIVLRTFFNCFMDRDWIGKNPFRSVKKKTQTVGRNLAYTEAEMELLTKKLHEKDLRLYFFTQIMKHCFIRRSEMVALKVKHIDLVGKTITIPGNKAKNNHQESVVIPKGLEPVLEEMELHKYNSELWLFGRKLETCTTEYVNVNHISARYTKFMEDFTIDKEKGLYSWKHSGVCMYYHLTGKDVYSLMRQLRHRDLNTTMIYLKSMGLIQNDVFRNASGNANAA